MKVVLVGWGEFAVEIVLSSGKKGVKRLSLIFVVGGLFLFWEG